MRVEPDALGSCFIDDIQAQFQFLIDFIRGVGTAQKFSVITLLTKGSTTDFNSATQENNLGLHNSARLINHRKLR